MQRDLVERAQRGDRDAFAVLADASLPRLYNLAQLMIGDRDVAEDAVQEALIVTWRDLRALRDVDRFDAWIHRILVRCVYRLSKNERRQRDRRRLAPLHEPTAPDPAHSLESRDAIDRGFRDLKPEFRAVLVIHHYLGLSGDEAAEILGVPVGTFRSRLNRATAAMRAELEADSRAGGQTAAEASR